MPQTLWHMVQNFLVHIYCTLLFSWVVSQGLSKLFCLTSGTPDEKAAVMRGPHLLGLQCCKQGAGIASLLVGRGPDS